MADLQGQRLGNYRLIHLVGNGGMAEIYLGRDIHLETTVRSRFCILI